MSLNFPTHKNTAMQIPLTTSEGGGLIQNRVLWKYKHAPKQHIIIEITYRIILPARMKLPTQEMKPERKELKGKVPTRRQ